MLTDTQAGKGLLNAVAYRLVVEQAPEELPIYIETRDQFLADPEGLIRPSQSADEVLGIGEVTIVKTFTRVLFPILTPMLQFLLVKVTEAFQEELGEEAVDWVKKLFDPKQPPQPIFTQTELEVIATTLQQIAQSEAKRLGLEEHQAYAVRDALITRLALAKL
jgi:hypothetical protein